MCEYKEESPQAPLASRRESWLGRAFSGAGIQLQAACPAPLAPLEWERTMASVAGIVKKMMRPITRRRPNHNRIVTPITEGMPISG